jgi:hypothetical protein
MTAAPNSRAPQMTISMKPVSGELTVALVLRLTVMARAGHARLPKFIPDARGEADAVAKAERTRRGSAEHLARCKCLRRKGIDNPSHGAIA